jgi:hypothetical protein
VIWWREPTKGIDHEFATEDRLDIVTGAQKVATSRRTEHANSLERNVPTSVRASTEGE